jgi:uncharacterized protein YdaU (DUF1376 family)
MENAGRRLGLPEWLILTGAVCFIFVLALSAYWEADIRWLHFFQAWMYVAAALLSLGRRRSVSFILTTGFFAADMDVFQPRYLAIFGRLLRPHLP